MKHKIFELATIEDVPEILEIQHQAFAPQCKALGWNDCLPFIFRLKERCIVVVTVGFASSFLPKMPKNPFRLGFLGCSCTLFCAITGT